MIRRRFFQVISTDPTLFRALFETRSIQNQRAIKNISVM